MCGWRRTSTPKMLASPRVDGEQGGEHPEHRGLAGAVGPEHAEDLAAADLEVDVVDRSLGAEGLDQPGGRDGQVGVGQVGVRQLCHAAKRGGQAGFTPPSRRFGGCGTGFAGSTGKCAFPVPGNARAVRTGRSRRIAS